MAVQRKILIALTCAGLALSLLPVAVAGGAESRAEPVRTVDVAITRRGFTLSSDTIRLGWVTFRVVNKDPNFGHDFAILSNGRTTWVGKTKPLAPRQRAAIRVRFVKPGRYHYISTLHDQIELGYAGYFVVAR